MHAHTYTSTKTWKGAHSVGSLVAGRFGSTTDVPSYESNSVSSIAFPEMRTSAEPESTLSSLQNRRWEPNPPIVSNRFSQFTQKYLPLASFGGGQLCPDLQDVKWRR
jgi:hypothetical protein